MQFSCWRHSVFVRMAVTVRWRLALTSNIRHENITTCQNLGFIRAILQTWQGGACGQSGSLTWWRRGATSELRLIPLISQVRYTGYRDRPIHERQNKFLNAARDGSTEIVSTIFIILTIKIELKSPVTGLVLVVLPSYQTNCFNFCEKTQLKLNWTPVWSGIFD